MHPEDWTRVQRGLEAALRTGAPVNVEYRIRPGDGSERWIASRGRPVCKSSGEPERLLGLSMDVTERKRTEEAMRANEARLAAGTELAGLGFFEVDYGRGRCFMDDRFRDICGIPRDLGEGLEPVAFWREHLHPADRPRVEDQRQTLHRGAVDRISTEYRYLHPTRGPRWLHHAARFAGGSPGSPGIRTLGVIRDITDYRRLAEEQAEDARFGTLISHVSSNFVNLPASEVDDAIEEAQRRICEFIGLDLSALWQPVEDTPGDYRLTHHYRSSGGPPIDRMSAEETFPWCRQRLLAGEVIAVSSLDKLPPEAVRDVETWRHFGVKTSLTLPLSVGGGPALGFLSFNDIRKEREWSDRLVKRLELVAQTFAHALARKRADQTLRESEARLRDLSRRLIHAHEEERARLARELHDDITQRLARLAIDLGRCEQGTSGVSPTETAREVREGLVRLSQDVHALSYQLHPSLLEELGLAEALKVECERFSRHTATLAEVRCRDFPVPLPPDIALGLFRVAQGAFSNISRHARASAVEVTLRPMDGGLQLVVRDNGVGFEPGLKSERLSLGLASMRERMLLLEGELDIESSPGHGTTVVAWAPITKAEG